MFFLTVTISFKTFEITPSITLTNTGYNFEQFICSIFFKYFNVIVFLPLQRSVNVHHIYRDSEYSVLISCISFCNVFLSFLFPSLPLITLLMLFSILIIQKFCSFLSQWFFFVFFVSSFTFWWINYIHKNFPSCIIGNEIKAEVYNVLVSNLAKIFLLFRWIEWVNEEKKNQTILVVHSSARHILCIGQLIIIKIIWKNYCLTTHQTLENFL